MIPVVGQIHVHLVPSALDPDEAVDSIVAVIDVLRAGSTIAYALANGARSVIACESVTAALETVRNVPNGSFVLGGERCCLAVDGFQLGNSPSEYTAGVVGGKVVVLTTSNGTRAIARFRGATRVVIPCFANLNAAVDLLASLPGQIHVVCAGTDGNSSDDDSLCAGAIVSGLMAGGRQVCQSDEVSAVLELFNDCKGEQGRFLSIIEASAGGRVLHRAGYGADIANCARWDTVTVVPECTGLARAIRPALVPYSRRKFVQAPAGASRVYRDA